MCPRVATGFTTPILPIVQQQDIMKKHAVYRIVTIAVAVLVVLCAKKSSESSIQLIVNYHKRLSPVLY